MTVRSNDKGPSTANDPDLDWSQVRETVRMLQLAVAQIDMSLREGDDSVQTLSNSFTSMITSVNEISRISNELECPEENSMVAQIICSESGKITWKMQESIVAFQFYDKLSQRLSHVSHALAALAVLVDDKTRLYNPIEWTELQGKIRSRYSMREEQEMFDLLLSGATIDEALEKGMAVIHDAEDGEIELF